MQKKVSQSLFLPQNRKVPTRISIFKRIVQAVAVPVVALGIPDILKERVGRKKPCEYGVEHPAIHIDKAELIKILMPGITTIEEEGGGEVGIAIVVRMDDHPFLSDLSGLTNIWN